MAVYEMLVKLCLQHVPNGKKERGVPEGEKEKRKEANNASMDKLFKSVQIINISSDDELSRHLNHVNPVM